MPQWEVRLVGFRGIGFEPTIYVDPTDIHESGLIKAGHAGLSLDGGKTVYGFHPTPEEIHRFGSTPGLSSDN